MKSVKKTAAFTVIELMTVVMIIAILSVLATQGYMVLQQKARRASCVNNLKSLFAAANSYVADNKSWPQVSTANGADSTYSQAWITAFKPYQLSQINWICPSIQSALLNPDLSLPENVRIDYTPMPFDANPASPYRYSTQPWFAEKAACHGDGNLLIFASGQVKSLNEQLADAASQPPPSP